MFDNNLHVDGRREEGTAPELLEAATALASELQTLTPVVAAGRPLPSGLVVVRAEGHGGKKAKPGGEFAGLEAAGWCEEEEGALRLTLVLVNIGSGRRGGVRLRAPHSAGWEAAGALALAEPAVPQDHSVATEQCVTLAAFR